MADIVGQGWKYPIRVNPQGGIDWSSGPSRIQQAIWIVISTSLGERVMRPTFGAGAADFVFEPNSPTKRASLATKIQSALTTWEPRITVNQVTVTDSPDQAGLVLASITYTIRSTNELFNMVYPLYLQEGLG
ncbi:MAG: GPW/gp25 family protein [Bryobacteraceae bacterium]